MSRKQRTLGLLSLPLAAIAVAAVVFLGTTFLGSSQANAAGPPDSGSSIDTHSSLPPGGDSSALGAWTIDATYDPAQITVNECTTAPGGVCTIDNDVGFFHASSTGATTDVTNEVPAQLVTLLYNTVDPTTTATTSSVQHLDLTYTPTDSGGTGMLTASGHDPTTFSGIAANIDGQQVATHFASALQGAGDVTTVTTNVEDSQGLGSIPIIDEIAASGAHHVASLPVSFGIGIAILAAATIFLGTGVLRQTEKKARTSAYATST